MPKKNEVTSAVIENPDLENPEIVDQQVESTPAVKDLEDEGEIAADYLEELLDIFDLDGDIDIDVRENRAYIGITAEGKNNLRLIAEPKTVDALQELTRIAVQVKTGRFSRLVLDVSGSREARVAELASLVERQVSKVKESGKPVHLQPMSSYERKIVHDFVEQAGLSSESEGEGKDRHIVIRSL